MMAGRYAHAKQFNRHRRQLRILRTRLGRIIRDIRRKIAGQPALEGAFQWPLARAGQIRSQQQRQRGWKLRAWKGSRPFLHHEPGRGRQDAFRRS
jgi:IS5 family transposase